MLELIAGNNNPVEIPDGITTYAWLHVLNAHS